MQILIEFKIVFLLFPLFLINELMNSANYLYQYTSHKIQYISACFDARDKFLSK